MHLAVLIVLASAAPGPEKIEVAELPRMTSVAFGCMLEKRFGHRDATYQCKTKPVETGDPCKNTNAYYAGPKFPKALVSKVASKRKIESIDITWEHGDLRVVTITFEGVLGEKDARGALNLNSKVLDRDNVQDISVQHCAKNKTCVMVIGFDHMGAGDVDCGG